MKFRDQYPDHLIYLWYNFNINVQSVRQLSMLFQRYYLHQIMAENNAKQLSMMATIYDIVYTALSHGSTQSI